MSDKMRKFFEPLTAEMRREHMIVNVMGGVGVLPAVMLARMVNSIWILFAVLILWWILVLFVYLVYCYIKNN